MENLTTTKNASMIYPGQYVPLHNLDEVEKESHNRGRGGQIIMAATVTDLRDSYKIDIKVPGASREEFFVYAIGNILFVELIHDQHSSYVGRTFTMSGFERVGYGCQVRLPENADLEFVSAEYREGILCLMVPKTNEPAGMRYSVIAVY